MTKFEVKLNEVNVTTVNNHPVRFIPVEQLYSEVGDSGQWHGWSYRVYLTKTGKLIAGFVSWSSVQGERDYLNVIIADDEKDLYSKLNLDNHTHRALAESMAAKVEIVPTV